jgi:uncharacterized phiE125 gp8 family phage protein
MANYVVTGPAAEPVLSADAKTHLRVDTTDDDTYIGTLITVARTSVERWIQRSLITQTRALTLPDWPSVIRLPMGPVKSITHVKYYDSYDVLQTLSASSYQTDLVSEIPRIALAPGESWPTIDDELFNPIIVTYSAGYGDTGASVPAPIKQAILLMIGHFYESREAVTIDSIQRVLPLSVEMLLSQYDISGASY